MVISRRLTHKIKKAFGYSIRDELLDYSYKLALTHEKRLNEKLNNEEYEKKSIRLDSVPTTYIIGLGNICNLRCPLCITGMRKQKKIKQFIEYEAFEKIIDKIKDYAIWVQLYKWGESLLHKDFISMLYKVKENNLAAQISTNLNINYDKDLFYAFVEAPLDHIIVSFDGLTQETYSKYRIGGSIQKVIDNLKLISQIKKEKKSDYPVIDLQFLVNKYNENDVEELKNKFKEFGADNAFATETIMPFQSNNIELAKQWLPKNELLKRKYFDVDLWMLSRVCSFLYKYMIIEQDLSIPPCCYATDPRDDFAQFDDSRSINDIYNSEKYIHARKHFAKFKSTSNTCETNNLVCHSCSVLKSYRELKCQ